jgi:UDP-2,3-diacylglucosamine pyrophosphatase LpxH
MLGFLMNDKLVLNHKIDKDETNQGGYYITAGEKSKFKIKIQSIDSNSARLNVRIGFMGDKAYDVALWFNNYFNYCRSKLGFGYWSLSKYLKHKVKKAIDFVFKFETNLTDYAAKRGFDGVICGHIHTPEIKHMPNGMIYMNDGDWVESCSALVEHEDGRWAIVYWNHVI